MALPVNPTCSMRCGPSAFLECLKLGLKPAKKSGGEGMRKLRAVDKLPARVHALPSPRGGQFLEETMSRTYIHVPRGRSYAMTTIFAVIALMGMVGLVLAHSEI